MSKSAVVCDTSLLLYLGRVEHQHLLSGLFESVHAPETVLLELDAGRLLRPDTMNPRKIDWIKRVTVTADEMHDLPANKLGQGEREVIAYAHAHECCLAGLDDWQARLLAEQLGVNVIGIVGILIKAKRSGSIASVQNLLKRMQQQGFYLSDAVYDEAVRLAGETQ